MRVKVLSSKSEKKQFIKFIYGLHDNDPYYCDTVLFNCRDLLFNAVTFAKNAVTEPVAVYCGQSIAAVCILIKPQNVPTLFMGCFEAQKNKKAETDLLFDYAEKRAKELGVKNLVMGINGHVSLGTGILQNCFNEEISFDSLYHPSYYKDYFDLRGYIKHGLCTYSNNQFKIRATPARAAGGFSIRFFDFKNYERDISIFERLTNDALKDTLFYFEPQEKFFYELFKSFKLLLKNENIIFAQKDGIEIGYAFWHPDFNKPLCFGKKNGAFKTWAKNRTFKHSKAKINAVAMQKNYRGSYGAALLASALDKELEKFSEIETTFVWDNNVKSVNLNLRNGFKVKRRYTVYEYITE